MVVFSLSKFVFELCLGSCLNLGFVFRFMPNIYFLYRRFRVPSREYSMFEETRI